MALAQTAPRCPLSERVWCHSLALTVEKGSWAVSHIQYGSNDLECYTRLLVCLDEGTHPFSSSASSRYMIDVRWILRVMVQASTESHLLYSLSRILLHLFSLLGSGDRRAHRQEGGVSLEPEILRSALSKTEVCDKRQCWICIERCKGARPHIQSYLSWLLWVVWTFAFTFWPK